MATPIAHASAGLACLALVNLALPGRLTWPLLWLALACAAMACAPDLDIAVSLAFTGSLVAWHSGPTHSLSFALAVGVAAWGLQRPHGGRGVVALAFALAAGSHVLIDWLTGPHWGFHPSFGVPALWPLLDERLSSPVTLFRGVKHGSIALWFAPPNLATATSELLFSIPAVLLSWRSLARSAMTRDERIG